jgi:hypothetical protein
VQKVVVPAGVMVAEGAVLTVTVTADEVAEQLLLLFTTTV